MRAKVMSYLGFAAKAGKIVNGYNTCMFMMEKRKVRLVLLAADLAENSIKKMISLASKHRVLRSSRETTGYLSSPHRRMKKMKPN